MEGPASDPPSGSVVRAFLFRGVPCTLSPAFSSSVAGTRTGRFPLAFGVDFMTPQSDPSSILSSSVSLSLLPPTNVDCFLVRLKFALPRVTDLAVSVVLVRFGGGESKSDSRAFGALVLFRDIRGELVLVIFDLPVVPLALGVREVQAVACR